MLARLSLRRLLPMVFLREAFDFYLHRCRRLDMMGDNSRWERRAMLKQRQIARTILLAVSVLLLICCIVLGEISGSTTASTSSTVLASMQRYEKQGLFEPSLFTPSPTFSWPNLAFEFKVSMTVDQIIKEMEAARSKLVGPETSDLSFVELVNKIGLLFTKGTKFDGKFQLNKVPKEDFINLYILDDDPQKI